MFVEIVGKTSRATLLDFLADHPTSDYPISELVEKSGLARQTIHSLVDDLVASNLLEQTRVVGRSRMFKITAEHPVVQAVIMADMGLLEHTT